MSIDNLQTLMLNSPYPWWEWEPDTNVVTFSPLKATMLGYDAEFFHGKGYQGFTDLVHPDDFERTMGAMRDLLSGIAELYQVDYRIKDTLGVYHWYMDRGVILERNANGRPKLIRGIVVDLGKEGEVSGSPESSHLVILNSLLKMKDGTKSFLVVCSGCQKVKSRSKHYVKISEELLGVLSEETSHSVCPDCVKKLYPELEELRMRKLPKL